MGENMSIDYTAKCFKLHFCCDIDIDKSLYDKYNKGYREKEEEKILDVLTIGRKPSFLLFSDLNEVKGKGNKYHFNVELIKPGEKKDLDKTIKKILSKDKKAKVLKQNVKKIDILQRKVKTTEPIQSYEGHLTATYLFEIEDFRSTVGIPFNPPLFIWGKETNIGEASVDGLGFNFEDSKIGLQGARIAKERKYFVLNFIITKEIMLNMGFLHELFGIVNSICPLFIEEIG